MLAIMCRQEVEPGLQAICGYKVIPISPEHAFSMLLIIAHGLHSRRSPLCPNQLPNCISVHFPVLYLLLRVHSCLAGSHTSFLRIQLQALAPGTF